MNNDTPEFYSARMAELLAGLAEKRQEMKDYMKELRKMYSALKVKVKKYEKIILTLDEERDKTTILYVSVCVQLALNKYREIEIKIARSREQKNYFEKGCRELPVYATQKEEFLTEKINRILLHHRDYKFRIEEAENILRIANKHLKKADDHFAFRRKLRR